MVYAVTGTLWDAFPKTIVCPSQTNNKKDKRRTNHPATLFATITFLVPSFLYPTVASTCLLAPRPTLAHDTTTTHVQNLFNTLKSSRVFIHRNGEATPHPEEKAGTPTRRRVNSASRSITRIASYSNELTRLLNFAKTFPRNQLPIRLVSSTSTREDLQRPSSLRLSSRFR